jgi:Zn-dependent oligopeptidase
MAAHTWSWTKDSILESTDKAIAAHKASLDAIVALPKEQVTFENVAQALSYAKASLSEQAWPLGFLQHVSPDAEVRDGSFTAENRIDDYGNESLMRVDVYEALQAAHKNSGASLQGEDKRLLEKNLLDRKRAGLALPEDKRKELLSLNQQKDKLQSEFSRNASEASGYLLFTKEVRFLALFTRGLLTIW